MHCTELATLRCLAARQINKSTISPMRPLPDDLSWRRRSSILSRPRRGLWHKSTFCPAARRPLTDYAMLLFANKHDAVTSLLRPCFSRRGFCLLQRRTRSSLNTPETGDCRIMRVASGKHPNCRSFSLSARRSRVCASICTVRMYFKTDMLYAESRERNRFVLFIVGITVRSTGLAKTRRPVTLTDGLLLQRRSETLIG